jgi:hypothetical protein
MSPGISKLTRQCDCEVNREIRQEYVVTPVKGLKQRQVTVEVWRFAI